MATTKKATTKAKVEEVVKEAEVEEFVIDEPPVKVKKTFNRDDVIPCKSVTIGGLWLDGIKTKRAYRWVSYGDVEYVEYQDLVPMISSEHNGYIYGPMFIIEDEDFIEEFPKLKDFYERKYTTKDLYDILGMDVNQMVEAINALPKIARENIKRLVSTQVSNGSLDSVKKIKALDEIFGTELSLIQSFTE